VKQPIDHLGYVVLAVPDLSHSIEFYQRVAHMKLVDRNDKIAYMGAGSEHHWIQLEERSDRKPGVIRIGYAASSLEDFDDVANQLDARETPYVEFGDLHGEGVDRGIRFKDPDGLELDLYLNMINLGQKPVQEFVNMDRFLHAVWYSSDPIKSHEFYADVLDFRPSDLIENVAVFSRARNGYHHSMGILKSTSRPNELDHFCILVPKIDDVLKARNIALSEGAPLRENLIRHAASGSISTYIKDETLGIAIEYCWDHAILPPDHRARILKAAPTTRDIWLVGTSQDTRYAVTASTGPLAVGGGDEAETTELSEVARSIA
jgi:2,3-dihydroxy-p-cumate/2,3-dihydroxybenzoate 3,4-dioxygenase